MDTVYNTVNLLMYMEYVHAVSTWFKFGLNTASDQQEGIVLYSIPQTSCNPFMLMACVWIAVKPSIMVIVFVTNFAIAKRAIYAMGLRSMNECIIFLMVIARCTKDL